MREGRSWRRRVAVTLTLLLAGTAVNVAVAWTLFAMIPGWIVEHTGAVSMIDSHPMFWSIGIRERTGAMFIDATAWRHENPQPMPPVPSWSATIVPPMNLGQVVQESAYGWPMLCMYSRNTWEWPRQHKTFPFTPIWPGLIVNSAIYGLAVYLCFTAFAAVFSRRRRRIQRGLCPACAYPIGASAVCTECGQALR